MQLNENDQAKSWVSIIVLSIAAFIFNTTEFLPIGLLTDIALGFKMSVSNAGLIMTVYAWTVTLLALPLAVLLAHVERRKLLIYIFLIFIASHILAAFAWDFNTLLIARLGIASSHAVFWAITIPIVVRLAPQGKSAKAMSLIITGSSLAMVLGIPLGTIIGQQFGWRLSFGAIAILASIILLLLLYTLPKLPSQFSVDFRIISKLLRRPSLIYVYMTLALLVCAYFTIYTYITPYLQQVGNLSPNLIIISLFIIGFSGILGGIIFAKKSDSHPILLLIAPMVILLTCTVTLHLATQDFLTICLFSLLFGVSITVIAMVLQRKVLEIAHDAPDIGMAMYSSIYNIGIGAGALLGGQIITHIGLIYTGYISAIPIILALILFMILGRSLWIIHKDNIKSH